jgi:hypothetical protein
MSAPSSRLRRARRPLPPAERSGRLLVRLAPEHVAMFRFLLEARDNLAGFTVLDRRECLLKVFFSPHQERDVRRELAAVGEAVPLTVMPWPSEGGEGEKPKAGYSGQDSE